MTRRARSEKTQEPQSAQHNPRGRWGYRLLLVGGEVSLTLGLIIGLFMGWYFFVNDAVVGNQQASSAEERVKKWSDSAREAEPESREVEDSRPVSPPVVELPAEGQEFAVLYVPRFGKDYLRPIAHGVDLETVLNNPTLGVGHYTESSSLGEKGNFAIAGHRTSFGAPFARIGELRLGDRLYIEVEEGWFIYRFRNLEYVKPTTVEVLNAFPHDMEPSAEDHILTLTSCHPRFSNAERIIAYAVLESWHPRAYGHPTELSHLADEVA